jgi:hypothetical protein
MQTLRVYRPRVIIHGPVGMGQGYIGAATLHHLEGYHVQSLELGTLMSDSTRVRVISHISTATSNIFFNFIDGRGSDCPTIYRSEAESTLGYLYTLPRWVVCRRHRNIAVDSTRHARYPSPNGPHPPPRGCRWTFL